MNNLAGRLAVIGGSGFIGSHVLEHGRSLGVDIASVRGPRVSGLLGGSVGAGADAWRRSHRESFTGLCRSLEPFDVVINAAGFAGPRSTDHQLLFNADAVLPAIVAHAARIAGVRRLVHISTAAVQGRRDPLDETPRHAPLSPYAAAKARAERYLLDTDGRQHRPAEVIVYRPTSVQGAGQAATRTLARVVGGLPAMVVAGKGDQPMPVSLIDNVAAGVVCAATMPDAPLIVLQPDERLTASGLLELFGVHKIVHLPARASNLVLDKVVQATAQRPHLSSYLRWWELLFHGQGIEANALVPAAFQLTAGHEAWAGLARTERRPGPFSRRW